MLATRSTSLTSRSLAGQRLRRAAPRRANPSKTAPVAFHDWRLESATHPSLSLSINELCAKEHNEEGTLGLKAPFLRLAIGGPDGRELSLTTIPGAHTVAVQGTPVEAGTTRLVRAGDCVRVTGLPECGEGEAVELLVMRDTRAHA